MNFGRVVCRILPVALLALPLFNCAGSPSDGGWRTIEFETDEVTDPDVVVSPDGRWLIFTMLGHLFQLPISSS
jgi:hypothetical protein